jgi:hypothetical protein
MATRRLVRCAPQRLARRLSRWLLDGCSPFRSAFCAAVIATHHETVGDALVAAVAAVAATARPSNGTTVGVAQCQSTQQPSAEPTAPLTSVPSAQPCRQRRRGARRHSPRADRSPQSTEQTWRPTSSVPTGQRILRRTSAPSGQDHGAAAVATAHLGVPAHSRRRSPQPVRARRPRFSRPASRLAPLRHSNPRRSVPSTQPSVAQPRGVRLSSQPSDTSTGPSPSPSPS